MCVECSGSGGCDACDGYGTLPGPEGREGAECDVCEGSGVCVECLGADPDNNNDGEHERDKENGS